MSHVWNFIDTVFNDADIINELRGETASSSSSKRKNRDRSIGGIEPLERKKVGRKCDMIFAKESCGHDEVIEYGALETGKYYDGDVATKHLEEGSIKLPKCLKDMLDGLLLKANDTTQVQIVGFIHSGLQSYVIRADRPTKYIQIKIPSYFKRHFRIWKVRIACHIYCLNNQRYCHQGGDNHLRKYFM